MNRDGHIIWSQFILIVVLGLMLSILLQKPGSMDVFAALTSSVLVYILGATLPDWDHPKVQEKLIILKWLKRITKHRGHWHSLTAMLIYGGLLFLIFRWLIHLWLIPIIAGAFGFFTHLLLDELKNLKTNGSRALKIW